MLILSLLFFLDQLIIIIPQKFIGALTEVFHSADRAGMKSIALPAIGTGGLGYPPNEVARLMFQAAISFSKKNPTGPLTDIRFVQYDQDRNVIKVICK